ncbi:hypothetical protein RQP54_17470 [Curvibacter sp. APW13]|uniref:hypothetical protein n=1 Tax=Curvibacter sp. APW13 TaxID=3077236 RepID=UPI0028DE3AAD|nr:hypothetical protein [Curvibacter sp. APW13]MDT8992665.1 hypothetical protein [Curvibacter sp. APW13]
MLTILIATEANEGRGHVAPWSGLVSQAKRQGYAIHMAAPDTGLVHHALGTHHAIDIWCAPSVVGARRLLQAKRGPIGSWPELLVDLGYANACALLGAVKAWRSILSAVQPHVVLADYAPAIHIAAKTLNVPFIEAGVGFCVPPLVPGAVGFPGISRFDPHAARAAANALCQAWNASLAAFGHAPIHSFSETASWPIHRAIMSPPELDPYGPRADVLYAGLALPDPSPWVSAPPREWPLVVGYLKANTPGLNTLVSAMQKAALPALLYVPGYSPLPSQHQSSVHFSAEPLNLAEAMQHAQFYLSNGGLTGVAQALHAGCWPIVVPQQAEQVATARNLLQRNWGSAWHLGQGAESAPPIDPLFQPRSRQARFAGQPNAHASLLSLIRSHCETIRPIIVSQ